MGSRAPGVEFTVASVLGRGTRPGVSCPLRPASDEEGTVEFLLAEGLFKKTRENELKFTQCCFRRLFC